MNDYLDNDNLELNGDDFEDLFAGFDEIEDDDADPYGGEWDCFQCQFDDDPSPYSGTYSEM